MKLRCTNTNGAKGITEGKTYTVKQAKHKDYWKLKNDNGEMKCYNKYRFQTIEE